MLFGGEKVSMGKRKNITISPVEKPPNTETKETKKSKKSNNNNTGKSKDKPNTCNGTMAQNVTHTVSNADSSILQNSQFSQIPQNLQTPQTPHQFAAPAGFPFSPYIGAFNPINTSSPVLASVQTQSTSNTELVLQTMLNKIEGIEQKMGQLSEIRIAVRDITTRLDGMNKKVTELESSQQFLSEQYESISSCNDTNKAHIKELQTECTRLTTETARLKESRDSLAGDLTDLRCRSMRDNMLFFGIPETSSALSAQWTANADTGSPKTDADQLPVQGATANPPPSSENRSSGKPFEDCESKVHYFLENILKIDNSRQKVHIDRAHRIRTNTDTSVRPVVAKFSDTASKLEVKRALKSVNLRGTPYNVTDQFPPEVLQRRKDLIPVMIQARKDGKRATLVRDKLFINGREYKPPVNPSDNNSG